LFIILNKKFTSRAGSDFTFELKQLKVVPENIIVFLNDESYFMEQNAQGEFSFKIKPIQSLLFHVEEIEFYLQIMN
jgi:hypothetical protein